VKAAGRQRSPRRTPSREVARLRARLAEADETLRAIRSGEVDAVIVAGKQGARVFTLEGGEHAYRVLIESINEGALTLAADDTILYANRSFARMVKCTLEQVLGGSLGRFLSAHDRATLRPLLERAKPAGSTIRVLLQADDGSRRPAQLSIRPLPESGSARAIVGVVVTDMTEALRQEDTLRALSRQVVKAQESERGRVALELHDNITQLLCAILFRIHALTAGLPAHDERSKGEALKVTEMLGTAVTEVERISRKLRPSILDQLGLAAVLRSTTAEFSDRTGVSVSLGRVRLATRLPPDTALALYRILQEALMNVDRHARAGHVRVSLTQQGGFVQLVIRDDGIGFDPEQHTRGRRRKGGLGLLGMLERAASAGGTLEIKSGRRAGTVIDVRIPLPPPAAAASREDSRGE
jgi:PAS domain S-box-containing protein